MIWQELEIEKKNLKDELSTLKEHGTALALAEAEYKKAVSKKALELKADGMPITLINTVIYGMDEISELRLKRDIAQVVYESNQEAINVEKLFIRIIESQMQREWSNES